MKLFYVRHAKTEGNAQKIYVGRSESPLLDEGVEATKKLAKHILDSGLEVDVIYASSLARALRTSQIIAEQIGYPAQNIVVNDLLLERNGGSFEGKPQAQFFAASEAEQIAAGAESFEELAKRATDIIALVQAKHPNETALLVGSATIDEMIRTMVKYNDPSKVFDDGPMPNTELVQLI